MKTLKGMVALVAGSSRGAGKGIALALGKAGAIVYVTGRSINGDATDDRNETIEKTVEEIKQFGGEAIAVRCDHTNQKDVELLFERIKKEYGRLDILINSVFAGSEDSLPKDKGKSFWQRAFIWDAMMVAPKAYLLTTRYAVPLLMKSKNGLIANISFFINNQKLDNIYYDLSMNSINRLSGTIASELEKYHITTLALSPGFMKTERVISAGFGKEATETTAYVGRAVVALASDINKYKYNGKMLTVAELARSYQFTDIDGSQPVDYK